MNNSKTHALVLGAGSSAPYGYPVTEKFANDISEILLTHYTKERVRLAHFLHYNNNPDQPFNLDSVYEAILELSPNLGIAEELENTFIELVLTKCLDYEKSINPGKKVDLFPDTNSDWIYHFVNFLNKQKFNIDQLVIPTLNYDNVFEHFFYHHAHYLNSLFKNRFIDVRHLHGDTRKGMTLDEKANRYASRDHAVDIEQDMFTKKVSKIIDSGSIHDLKNIKKIFLLGINYQLSENLENIAKLFELNRNTEDKKIHIFVFSEEKGEAINLADRYQAELADSYTTRIIPYNNTKFHPIYHNDGKDSQLYTKTFLNIISTNW